MTNNKNEMEYMPYVCYKCKKTPILFNSYSLCKSCVKEYNKTWYYKISRTNTWPKNLISGHPVKFFGIYLFSILKIAKDNYIWECSERYDKGNCRCPEHTIKFNI